MSCSSICRVCSLFACFAAVKPEVGARIRSYREFRRHCSGEELPRRQAQPVPILAWPRSGGYEYTSRACGRLLVL